MEESLEPNGRVSSTRLAPRSMLWGNVVAKTARPWEWQEQNSLRGAVREASPH